MQEQVLRRTRCTSVQLLDSMAVDVQSSGYVRMAKTIRNGSDVYLVPNQERGSSMPEAMQRDQWQILAFVRLLGIIIIDDPVECLIGSIQTHQSTVPLNEYVIVTDPLGADRKPVCSLLSFSKSGNIHNSRRHCYSSTAFGCLGGFGNGFSFCSADALAELDLVDFSGRVPADLVTIVV